MNNDEFETLAIKVLGSPLGWQSKIARVLDVNDRTVRRWLATKQIPSFVNDKLVLLLQINNNSPYPRDEWVIGDNDKLSKDKKPREYIIHVQYPRFIARITSGFHDDDDGFIVDKTEMPCDLNNTVYVVDDETVLCEINWFDIVDASEAAKWLDEATNQIQKQVF